MINWIKTHKLLTAALAGGAFLLYYLWKHRGSSSSSSTLDPTAAYLQSYYSGGGGGAANVNAGQGGGTGLVDLGTLQSVATPGGAVNQVGTSGSGVPSSSSHTQEFTPNTLATPAPVVSPIASAFTPSPVSVANMAPTVAIPCNPNDSNCFTTNAYIKASNQNVDAHFANEGLAPIFTQGQFDTAWTGSGNGANGDLMAASLGQRNVISAYEVPNDIYARAGFTRNAAGTYDAINQGASVTGFDASGNPIVDWGHYAGPGSPNYKAPTVAPPPPSAPPSVTTDQFTGGGRTPGSGPAVTPPDTHTRTGGAVINFPAVIPNPNDKRRRAA
jgi:hypothetical protein